MGQPSTHIALPGLVLSTTLAVLEVMYSPERLVNFATAWIRVKLSDALWYGMVPDCLGSESRCHPTGSGYSFAGSGYNFAVMLS